MSGIWEAREVASHLRKPQLHHLPTDSRDALTALDLLLKRGQAPLQFLFDMRDRPALRLNQTEQLAQEKAMVLAQLSRERGHHLFLGGFHTWPHPTS